MKIRYVLKQQSGYSGFDELNFEGSFTWPLQTKGMQNAQDALNGNGVVNVADFINHWVQNEEIQALFPNVSDFIDFNENILSAEPFSN